MPAYFITEYTIHFDDTMAYGSHHFLTSFKFQCAARESFLFGEHLFDVEGVKEELQQIQLLTSDAYSRNLRGTHLGDRLAILLSLEEWGQASARFCYRVINDHGEPVCAGYQTLISADTETGTPVSLPPRIRRAMDGVRQIEERRVGDSFRDCVLAGGHKLEPIFGNAERRLAIEFLSTRHSIPGIVSSDRFDSTSHADSTSIADDPIESPPATDTKLREAWVFAGQGAFDADLFCRRVSDYARLGAKANDEIAGAREVTSQMIGGDAEGLFSGSADRCRKSIAETPEMLQVGIHLQNVLGAKLWQSRGHTPSLLMGHSFGEIAAFEIGGCFDLVTGVRIVCLRAQVIAKYAPKNSGLLAVLSDRDRAHTEARLMELDQVVVAGRNHPKQTVLSGPLEQLGRLQRHLPTVNINSVSVPSPTSFHHPALHLAAAKWRDQLSQLRLDSPKREIYSPIGRRFVRADDDIATVLSSQLLRPFDLQSGVSDAIVYGVNQFVDCGSTGSLARLISESCREGITVCTATPDTSIQQSDRASIVTESNASGTSRVTVRHGEDRQSWPKVFHPAASDSGPAAIAVVGQGCILPGGATCPERLYEAIMHQTNGIVDQRDFDPLWANDFFCKTLVADRSTSPLAGRVDDADIRAPSGIAPDVFNEFSRTQKLLCVALAPCLASLREADRVLCLIGATADGFEDQDLITSLRYAGIDLTDQAIDQQLNVARLAAITPHAAIQEVFDRVVRPGLKVTLVDAACASSLYTVALGMQALERNKVDAVIAGGCFCPGPGNSCLFAQFHGTTSTGCRPFDAGADGVVFSEGAALVTLRRADDADRLGLPIEGIIRGIGLSSDGRSPSANVPQSRGQILSLERCYKNYGIDPKTIQAIEGHGTSTNVGDSTELKTLQQFFAGHVATPIPVHSLKGLLGHAGWAAGTASLIAACEYLRQGVFPAQAGHHQPSDTLKSCVQTLMVPTRPIRLPNPSDGIAIDGFGFGGANAHMVVGNNSAPAASRSRKSLSSTASNSGDDDLVFVAYHQIDPTIDNHFGKRFDRTRVSLPDGCVVLPQLADDMDISQTLSVLLNQSIIKQLANVDDELKQVTGLVLAMQGKTQRGIEATARIMADRYRRMLNGLDEAVTKMDAAKRRTRPSGPYTLQCMMPNVATGRAALLLNLNGPNFVVDAGADSLEAAITSADLLLRGGDNGGTKLVIVSAIASAVEHRNGDRQITVDNEYAVAFAVTTRRFAKSKGWKVLSTVDDAWSKVDPIADRRAAESEVGRQADALLSSLGRPTNDRSSSAELTSSESGSPPSQECQLHVPVWVRQDPSQPTGEKTGTPAARTLFIASADDQSLITSLLADLPRLTPEFHLAIAGKTAQHVVNRFADDGLIAVDVSSTQSLSSAWDCIDNFNPTEIVAVSQIEHWDLDQTLPQVATDNSVCEFLFLAAQRNIKSLRQGRLGLWGLFVDGYDGRVHAKSGAIAGLLKSIHREIPETRVGCICTRDMTVRDAIGKLLDERRIPSTDPEIIYDGAVRLVRRLRATSTGSTSTDPAPSDSSAYAAAPAPMVKLDRNSVVVATGGAKGVTAIMLETILRDHQCTVVALGRSHLESGPENPDDATIEQEYYRRYLVEHPGATAREMKQSFKSTRANWDAARQIQVLSALEGNVDYMVADVTDRDQVCEAVKQIVSRHGRIDLVIHGAGIQLSKKLEDRTLAEFQNTYATKVLGLSNLTNCVRQHLGQPVATHLLTSAYSVFGNDGQHDYGAANETMDRLCEMSAKGDSKPWSSIAWLAWDSIGMTRGSEYRILAQQRGLSGVKPIVGQQLFRDVMSGRTGSAINVPLSESERVRYQLKTIPQRTQTTPSNGRIIEAPVVLSQIDCLPFHKVRQTPTLPGAWILERMVNAAMKLLSHHDAITSVTVRDMSFMRFVRFVNGQEPNVRVVAEETDTGFATWMICDVLHPSGRVLAKDVVCANADLNFSTEDTAASPLIDQPPIANGFAVEHFTPDPYCQADHRQVELSGPFRCLHEIKIGAEGRSAKYVPRDHFQFPACITTLLLDAAWRVAAIDAVRDRTALFVPVKIDRMVIPAGPTADAMNRTQWEVRSTTPYPFGTDVRWRRTEVLDRNGAPRLVVENGFAKRIV
ncbi:MAG: SDR family oxidoreductase [Planctomycetales bacterium]|nr:SDR family oxidoreductase [Planctomycetales bacterium]